MTHIMNDRGSLRSGGLLSRAVRTLILTMVSLYGSQMVSHAFGAIAVGTGSTSDGSITGWEVGAASVDEETPSRARLAALETRGMESETEFMLSLGKTWGIWRLESSYVGDWELEGGSNRWVNELRLGGRVIYDKWNISPEAEFTWEGEGDAEEALRFRMNMSREL